MASFFSPVRGEGYNAVRLNMKYHGSTHYIRYMKEYSVVMDSYHHSGRTQRYLAVGPDGKGVGCVVCAGYSHKCAKDREKREFSGLKHSTSGGDFTLMYM